MSNIGVDLPGGLPYQPWLVPIVKERTANNAIDSFSGPLKQAEEQAAQAQQQLKQNAKSGGSGSQIDLNQLNRLQRCVQKAHQDVNRLQRCTERFAP